MTKRGSTYKMIQDGAFGLTPERQWVLDVLSMKGPQTARSLVDVALKSRDMRRSKWAANTENARRGARMMMAGMASAGLLAQVQGCNCPKSYEITQAGEDERNP